MKVLSVRQPWAWALIHGGRDVENRSWPTKHRGLVAIHAGKQYDLDSEEQDWMLVNGGDPYIQMLQGFCDDDDHDARSAIIGVVEVYDCVPSYKCDSPWRAGPDPDYFCWLVRNPIALAEPIPWKGQLGLFDVADSLFPEDDRISSQLNAIIERGRRGEA